MVRWLVVWQEPVRNEFTGKQHLEDRWQYVQGERGDDGLEGFLGRLDSHDELSLSSVRVVPAGRDCTGNYALANVERLAEQYPEERDLDIWLDKSTQSERA